MGSDLDNVLEDLKPKVQATVELNIIRNQSVQLIDNAKRKKDLFVKSGSRDSYLDPEFFAQFENLTKSQSI